MPAAARGGIVLARDELLNQFPYNAHVFVDFSLGGGRAHQRHLMNGGQQDAAVGAVEMDEHLQGAGEALLDKVHRVVGHVGE